jgi:ribosomal protein S18 acetylase RimI-like enzyme
VTLVVRLARADEVEAAVMVWRLANDRSALQEHPERLEGWAQEEGARLYVAAQGDRLVGMVLGLRGRADDGAGDVIPGLCHLTGLAVVPDRQRSGIGRSLMAALLADADRDRCHTVTLWTTATNAPALTLFASLGFRPTGRFAHDDSGIRMLQLARSRAAGVA